MVYSKKVRELKKTIVGLTWERSNSNKRGRHVKLVGGIKKMKRRLNYENNNAPTQLEKKENYTVREGWGFFNIVFFFDFLNFFFQGKDD